MKKIGIAAIVCVVAFLTLAITGGICVAIGATQLAADEDVREYLLTLGDDLHSIIENSQDYSNYSGTETYLVEDQVKTIKIEGFTGDINIVPSDSANTITIDYDGIRDLFGENDEHFKFYTNGDTLTISPKNRLDSYNFNGFVTASPIGKITVQIPMHNDLVVSTGYNLVISETVGEINVSNCKFGNITLESTVGEIDFENVTAQVITCNRTVGEIDADGSFTGIVITDTIGECTVETNTALTENSRIENNIADVTITLPGTQRMNFTTSSTVGDIDIDDILRDNTSSVDFEISGSIGNVTVETD